jgi:hypothetical protein
MPHNILVIVQLVINLAALFLAGVFVGKLHAAEQNIKRYRQMKEEAERETAKYAKHE